ncbi:ATP-binding cassette domain-containing protein [Bacteroidota bacterium]
MTNYSLSLENIKKIFGRRLVFKKINYSFRSGKIYGIAGPNGSGKSTIAKIIAGVLSPTKGIIIYKIDDKKIVTEKIHNHIGFVSPYLVMYEEFSAKENLNYFQKIRGKSVDNEKIEYWLNEFELYDRRDDLVKGFSSGMKQRLKLIFSFIHDPEFVVLDEPTSNLDNAGKEKVCNIIKDKFEHKLIILASNENNDLSLCGEILELAKYKN